MTDTATTTPTQTLTHARYPAYKDSGVDWLGEIPAHWAIIRLKRVVNLVSEKVVSKGSTFQYIGMENVESWTGKYVESSSEVEGLANYFEKGDILFGKLRPYLAKVFSPLQSGICSTEFIVLRGSGEVNKGFLHKSLLSPILIDVINSSTYGSKMPRASWDFIGAQFLPIPPVAEQTRIAEFLDRKMAQIDQAIAQKERLIELLNERRQVMIHQAVTRGLDSNVPMKDSGIDWIGEIPAHWEVKKLKFVLLERNDRSESGLERMFMVSQEHGLVVRSDYHDKAIAGQSSVGSKRVFYNDLVFNKLKAHLGVFFKSTIEEIGLVSPDYAVYYSNGVIEDLKFLELLFRHPAYIRQFICSATGIVEGLIRLYTSDLFNIRIPVPPVREQKKILNRTNEIGLKVEDALKKTRREIKLLQELKSTLINSAVTGKIRV